MNCNVYIRRYLGTRSHEFELFGLQKVMKLVVGH